MTRDEREPMSGDWDLLAERDDDGAEPLTDPVVAPAPAAPPGPDRLPPLQLTAAAWGDLASLLAVTTAALVGLLVAGHPVAWRALPWAVAVAVAWWFAATAATVLVRHGTVGMLLAGVRFEDGVPPRRVPWVVATCFAQLVLLGLPSALPATGSGLLRRVAGSPVRAAGERLSGDPGP